MSVEFPIQVTQGEIHVKGVSGKVEGDYFVLYLSTREKYPLAEVVLSGLVTQVQIFATKATLRPSLDGMSYVPIRADEPATLIELPGGWEVGVSFSKHTVCIMGAKAPKETRELPFVELSKDRYL